MFLFTHKWVLLPSTETGRRLVLLMGFVCASTVMGRPAVFGHGRAAFPVQSPAAGPQRPAAAQEDFDKIAADAKAASDADRLDEAIALYRKALSLRPQWPEGWWYLATILYDHDNYAEAARAFKETARLQPKAGAPWAMIGLCEFQLGHYDQAFENIEKGRSIGVGDNVELTRVMRYHEGILALLKGEFERAQMTLGTLSYEGLRSEDLIIGLGLSVLRIGMVPKQVDLSYRDRDAIRRAGLAEHFNAQKNISDATREYELLARDYPKFPNVQYCYGRFLQGTRDDEGALAAFQREIQNSPAHALARLQIAYIKLQRKELSEGVALAEEAVKLHPRLPLGHYILGRLYLDSSDIPHAIEQLEIAKTYVPDEPKIYFALAKAYTKANRKQDAERAREAFARLNQQAEEAAGRGAVRGDAIPDDNPEPKKPQQL